MDKNKIWLWGQTAGAHHTADNHYMLPGINRMTPAEGARFFGIENMCRVKMSIDSALDMEQDISTLTDIKKITLSIVGAGGCPFHKNGGNDLDDVLRIAQNNPKVTAGIMDDFISPERMAVYTPEVLRVMREKLHTSLARPVEFWSVIYERDLEEPIEERLRMFDLFTFWTWFGDKLENLEENYTKIRAMAGGVRMMLGVYMWDYGNCRPLSDDMMRRQLAFADEKYQKGEIEGIVLCSNCIADIGLSAVDVTKAWIDGK